MYRPNVFVLKSGVSVQLRQIAPGDKELLQAGFERLSKETIRHRFMGLRKGFTQEELRFLTEIDGVDHFAIGVSTLDEKEGIAVGRYIRETDAPEQAELALVIIDHYQRQGLGRKLLSDLCEHARQSQIQLFTGLMGPDNSAMGALLKNFPGARTKDGRFWLTL